ncbi:Putative surface protein bspA-like (TvBspA-like-625) [Durusdinium trenchii]|uniref:Surface protein bspA-like (TvBspA-like-625) n=1 Tax=Durusdinium trenchii TaxID=1381693 RepID=A0ABP0IHL5_9DINO
MALTDEDLRRSPPTNAADGEKCSRRRLRIDCFQFRTKSSSNSSSLPLGDTWPPARARDCARPGELRVETLKAVQIPPGTTRIEKEAAEGAFDGCVALAKVELPSSVSYIGPRAFRGCRSLSTVAMPSVAILGGEAFASCSSLRSVTLPSVKRILARAFEGCSALQDLTLPQSVAFLGAGAFAGCSLVSLRVPSSVMRMERDVFRGMNSLKSVLWEEPSQVSSLPPAAFHSCHALCHVTLPPSITELQIGAFKGCSSLETIALPSVITLGAEAFDGCRALRALGAPHVRWVGPRACRNCSALQEVDLPLATSLGGWAFEHCPKLTTLKLPKLTSVGSNAFLGCSALRVPTTVPLAGGVRLPTEDRMQHQEELVTSEVALDSIMSCYKFVMRVPQNESGAGILLGLEEPSLPGATLAVNFHTVDSALEAERICEGAILKVREVLEAREILSNKEMAARMHEALEQPILMELVLYILHLVLGCLLQLGLLYLHLLQLRLRQLSLLELVEEPWLK